MSKHSCFTKMQTSAISKARRILKKKPWYQGVCTNTVPHSDKEIRRRGFGKVVKDIVRETWYYDGQYYGRMVI